MCNRFHTDLTSFRKQFYCNEWTGNKKVFEESDACKSLLLNFMKIRLIRSALSTARWDCFFSWKSIAWHVHYICFLKMILYLHHPAEIEETCVCTDSISLDMILQIMAHFKLFFKSNEFELDSSNALAFLIKDIYIDRVRKWLVTNHNAIICRSTEIDTLVFKYKWKFTQNTFWNFSETAQLLGINSTCFWTLRVLIIVFQTQVPLAFNPTRKRSDVPHGPGSLTCVY